MMWRSLCTRFKPHGIPQRRLFSHNTAFGSTKRTSTTWIWGGLGGLGLGMSLHLTLGRVRLHGETPISPKPLYASGQTIIEDISKDAPPLVVAQKDDEVAIPPVSSWRVLSRLWQYISKDWLLLGSIVAISCGSALINIYIPSVMGEFATWLQVLHSTGRTSSTIAAMNQIALKLLGLFSAQGLLTFLDIHFVTILGERLSSMLKKDLFSSILAQDMSFFDSRMHGEIASRLSSDLSDFKHTIKICVTQGLKALTQIVGTCAHLIWLSPSLSGTLLCIMPGIYFGMNSYGAYLRKISRLAKESESKANGVAGEAIANIRTVKSFASEEYQLEKYLDSSLETSLLNQKLGFHIGLFQGSMNTSVGLLTLLILFFGGRLVAQDDMSPGKLMSYLVATQSVQRSFSTMGVLFGQAVKAVGSGARLFEYMDLKPRIPNSGGKILDKLKGDIEFSNIYFKYPTRTDDVVLQKFNLVIPAGKVVALCGPSGSGKSTIGQLLERFYDPNLGKIILDGHDLKSLDPSWLRKKIGYIDQEPVLFAGSIYDNIRYGRPDASDAEVFEAARLANASGFIDTFPSKYETLVGERGVTLSGGQKQRIAIARAILKDPKILILDEATSALDNQSERIVQEALQRLMRDRTVLVIAHRLSTIQGADQIVVMNSRGKEDRMNGNIVEMGTHEELLARKGFYYSLYNQHLLT